MNKLKNIITRKLEIAQVQIAELIVRECIDIVGEYSEDGAHCQRQMIKERFGIEE